MKRHTYTEVQAIAKDMITSGSDLRNHFDDIDDIIHSKWEVPEAMDLDWIVPVVVSDPATAFYIADKSLSIEEPEVHVMQTTEGEDNEAKVDNMEKWLKWQYRRARERSDADPYEDKVHSALRYDIVCGQVIHLDHEKESAGKLGKKLEGAVPGGGDFAVRMASAKNVYVRKSVISGLEAVLHVYETRASDVVGTWGKNTKKFQNDIDYPKKNPIVTVYDYTSKEQRMVWIALTSNSGGTQSSGLGRWKLVDKKWDLDFLNWFYVRGGTNLEEDDEFSVNPLLGRVARTELFDQMNILETLVMSEAVATSGYPRFGIIGPNGDMVEVIYHDPSRLMNVPDGHTIVDLRERRIDEGLIHLSDRTKARMDRETVSRFLQNLDMPDRAAYASVHHLTETALAGLHRYKKLVERALVQMFSIMFLYVKSRRVTSVGFSGRKGEQIALGWDTFDPNYVFIEAECIPKTASDYQQKINAGQMMLQIGVPLQDVFKFIGFNNSKDMIERKAMEQLQQFELGLRQQEEAAQSQIKIQEQAAMSQLKLRQQMQPQQAPQQPQQEQMPDQSQNPNMGGQPDASPEQAMATQMGQETGGMA